MNEPSKNLTVYVRDHIMGAVDGETRSTFSAHINKILVQARGIGSDDVHVTLSADPTDLNEPINEDLLMMAQDLAYGLVSEYTNHDPCEFYLHEVYTPMNHTVICHVLNAMT